MKPLMMMKALPSLECEKYRYKTCYTQLFSYFVQIQTACITIGINLVQICFFIVFLFNHKLSNNYSISQIQ